MFIVFNELSTLGELIDVKSESEMQDVMDSFTRTIFDLSGDKYGMKISYRVHENKIFHEKSLYECTQYMKDRDRRSFVRRYFDKYCEWIEEKCSGEDFELTINNKRYSSVDCLYAIKAETAILSLLTNKFWEQDEISGSYISICNGEINEQKKKICNITTEESSKKFKECMRKRMHDEIDSFDEFWKKRKEVYPHLDFCEEVKFQLEDCSGSFQNIKKKLWEMEKYFASKPKRYIPEEMGMDARTESSSVKTNPNLKEHRCFTLLDGTKEYFFDHISFSSGGRIYFLPKVEEQKCYIGYIGSHLPTAQF